MDAQEPEVKKPEDLHEAMAKALENARRILQPVFSYDEVDCIRDPLASGIQSPILIINKRDSGENLALLLERAGHIVLDAAGIKNHDGVRIGLITPEHAEILLYGASIPKLAEISELNILQARDKLSGKSFALSA